MSCALCVRHVAGALEAVDGVRVVDVNLRDGKVVVLHERDSSPKAALVEALRDAGYKSEAEDT